MKLLRIIAFLNLYVVQNVTKNVYVHYVIKPCSIVWKLQLTHDLLSPCI